MASFWKIHMRHFGWFLNTVHHRKNQIKTSTVIGFASICKDTTQKNTFGFFGGCILCIGYTCRVLCNNEAKDMQNKTKTKLKSKKFSTYFLIYERILLVFLWRKGRLPFRIYAKADPRPGLQPRFYWISFCPKTGPPVSKRIIEFSRQK